MGHPLAFELAQQLVRMLPGDIDHVFFGNSGSEAVDTALKIALAYWQSKGQPQRVRFIGRSRGYHGVGFGGIAVGGIEANRKQFAGQLLPAVDHLQHTHDLSRNAYSRGQPRQGAELANELEAVVQKYGADTIAAVIVEPVAGSTGVLIPPVGYLDRLREICDRHGILLIFDEVITGFGRLGAPFAADKFGVVPDIMTVAKGITNATVPMGAVCVRHGIYDCVVNASASGIELFHGYTYSRGTRHVVDLRNIGIVGAVELEARPGAPGARGFEAFLKCFDAGVLVRSTGDTLALSPPLIVEREEIDRIFETVGQALREIA
jgi:beta-alanine--pyruvate transaminase